MNERSPSDPLDHLLAREDFMPPAGLEQQLRAATLGYVRRRRQVRRALQAGVAFCVVMAGVALVWFAAQRPGADADTRQAVAAPLRDAAREQRHEAVAVPTPPVSGLSLEWQAFDSQTERASRYFRAGDQYLEVEGDYDGALRCYEQALASSEPEDLEFSNDDNWLVLALKHARLKETRHD